MKWLAWGWRVLDGEKEPYIVGELECKSHAISALVFARKKYGYFVVDRVQSALSHEVDLLEAVDKRVLKGHRPRPYKRKPSKKHKRKPSLNDARVLNNIMSSGNTSQVTFYAHHVKPTNWREES